MRCLCAGGRRRAQKSHVSTWIFVVTKRLTVATQLLCGLAVAIICCDFRRVRRDKRWRLNRFVGNFDHDPVEIGRGFGQNLLDLESQVVVGPAVGVIRDRHLNPRGGSIDRGSIPRGTRGRPNAAASPRVCSAGGSRRLAGAIHAIERRRRHRGPRANCVLEDRHFPFPGKWSGLSPGLSRANPARTSNRSLARPRAFGSAMLSSASIDVSMRPTHCRSAPARVSSTCVMTLFRARRQTSENAWFRASFRRRDTYGRRMADKDRNCAPRA